MRILLHRSYLMAMILCISIVCMVATACAESNKAGYISIKILSVNDFHGALAETGRNPGIAKLAAFLKAESAQNSDSTIIVSAGDMFQGTPDSNLLHGRPVMNAMNESGFAAMTLGNHEFDWGQDMLKDLLSQAKFPVIAANVLDKATGKPVSFVKPYVIINPCLPGKKLQQ
jgi:5'-nucleotidase/UDP-sugar diphosphatase